MVLQVSRIGVVSFIIVYMLAVLLCTASFVGWIYASNAAVGLQMRIREGQVTIWRWNGTRQSGAWGIAGAPEGVWMVFRQPPSGTPGVVSFGGRRIVFYGNTLIVLIPVGLLAIGWTLRLRQIKIRRQRSGHCVNCGYDKRGLLLCPECGK